MGDRTYVELTVHRNRAGTAKAILDSVYEGMFEHEIVQCGQSIPITVFEINEVANGDLDELDRLIAHGIAYDSSWGLGDNYRPGTEYARFTPEGWLIRKLVWDEDRNPDHCELMRLLDQPELLRAAVMKHDERVGVPGWSNQDEYGRRYLWQVRFNIPFYQPL